MNRHRDTLSEALHELAATSPGASPELHVRLGEAFVHHHARRRVRQRVLIVVALAACVGISVYWLRPRGEVAKVKVVEPASQTAEAPSPAPKGVAPESPKLPAPSIARANGKPRVHVKPATKPHNDEVEPSPAPVETADFVALPSFDPAIPVGESRMVRMDLPGSTLQLMGYPIEGQFLDHRIVTDVLVGQDGMPYAVRLVPARNVY